MVVMMTMELKLTGDVNGLNYGLSASAAARG